MHDISVINCFMRFHIRPKIILQREMVRIARAAKRAGKRIVTINGSFDVLHAGHVRVLEEARAQGDILIVMMNSDRSVQMYKGPRRPIVPERERVSMLAGLACVDYVTLFHEINPKRMLRALKPDVHCNGSDWGKDCVERETVEAYGGRIHIVSWHRGYSTTCMVEKIFATYSKPDVRAVFVDRDGTINDNSAGATYRVQDFKFLPYAIRGLRMLTTHSDFKIIVVTNQSGIGRGQYSERDTRALHRWLIRTLAGKGVRIDKIYHCPHTPEDRCVCRKPEIGMFLQAVRDFGISLNHSYMIGDDPRDVIAGREANITTIKIGDRMPQDGVKLEPHYYAKDLKDAAGIIIGSAR